ncbi:MAG TPA: TetR family transcriptional regulator [Ramlibacter sp.]|uniref:TetR family transcriptional regulator n=1 Tax=Ramlibacter sp. TaxID=1917967 RepID=UPI002B74DCF9|nr:TetR family transcriptional regulator [Ramlibacter sp.]HVZ42658.1 TetR family transcriptional regulator [Ramlibacter sp.]
MPKSDPTKSETPRNARGDAVRTRLLDVAERLFAEKGIDVVSLNSIAREANQLNASVMQYHFGTKMQVIEAILERRMEELNRRRSELIANVDVNDPANALHQIAEAMVLPFAEHLFTEGGSTYLRFVAQVTFNADQSVFEMMRGKHDSAVRRIAELVQQVCIDLQPEVVRHRLAVVTNLVLFTIGEREKLRMAGRRTGVARLASAEFIVDLVEMIVGALMAPAAPPERLARLARLPAAVRRGASQPAGELV